MLHDHTWNGLQGLCPPSWLSSFSCLLSTSIDVWELKDHFQSQMVTVYFSLGRWFFWQHNSQKLTFLCIQFQFNSKYQEPWPQPLLYVFSMLLYFLPSPSYASSPAPTHTHTYSHFLCFSSSLSFPPLCWVNCNLSLHISIEQHPEIFFSPLSWTDLLKTSSLAGPWHLNPFKGYNSGWDDCTLNLIFIPRLSLNQRSSQFYIYLFIELRISLDSLYSLF